MPADSINRKNNGYGLKNRISMGKLSNSLS
jgi:hypothetical protein